MSDKVLVTESILEDIGSSIRLKNNSEDLIQTKNFPDAIKNLPQPGISSFPGTHVDKNGKWHKPEEWDDIESIDISDKHECYLLCSKLLNDTPYVSLTVEADGDVYWSYGHVVNGEFIKSDSSTRTKLTLNTSHKATFGLYLGDLTDDYIVIKIEASNYLANISPSSYTNATISSQALPAQYSAILMRYGRYVKGTTLGFKNIYIESDNLVDFAKDYQNTTTTITAASGYAGCYGLQRFRMSGADLSKNKITSFDSLFSTCYSLADLSDCFDMTGWVTSNCTSVKSMFSACFSIKSKLIVKNWDISNVTDMSYLFSNAYSLPYIEGLETWNKAAKCKTFRSMFLKCYSLQGTIDLSSLYIGNSGTSLNTDAFGTMFQMTKSLNKIILNNANLSTITTLASVFGECAAEELIWDENFTPPTNISQLTSTFSASTGFRELVFDGWNLSSAIMSNMFNNAYGLRKLVFRNCTPPTTISDTTETTVPFTYMHRCTYLDISDFDFSKCTSTAWHSKLINASVSIVDFYPPQHICKDFMISSSQMLSHDSLIRVLNNLDTVSTATKLTLGSSNLGRLSNAEKAIATDKGWTLA